MEELRSTEILGREIKEDARKKADRILKNAEAEAAEIKSGVFARIEKAKKEKERFYSNKLQAYKDNCNASIPLEKQRKKILYIHAQIQDALDSYFSKIDDEKKLKVISKFLDKFKSVIGSTKIIIRYTGISKADAEKLIKENFPEAGADSYHNLSTVEAELEGLNYGLIVEDQQKTFLCKADINRARDFLLTEKREELKNALFGGYEIE